MRPTRILTPPPLHRPVLSPEEFIPVSGSIPSPSSAAPNVRQISLLAIIFLVVLRLSIGWQLFYEGIWKINTLPTAKPWTAEGYLKNSAGPFRDTFRGMIDDPDGLDKLDFAKQSAYLDSWVANFIRHYGNLDEAQTKRINRVLEVQKQKLEDLLVKNKNWVGDQKLGIVGEIEVYRGMLEKYNQRLKAAHLDFEREHLEKSWSDIQEKYKQLIGPVDEITKELQTEGRKLLNTDQLRTGSIPQLPRKVDQIDQRTIWSLTVFGGLLILGLFTRLASLGAAGLILLFYLAMPPWPGVPEAPGPEHSFIVNKNLIEVIALLALAVLPSGRWLGLDAWIHRFLLGGKSV